MPSDRVTNPKNIRARNWPYMLIWILYYAWVIVFTTWWTASPLTDQVFGTDIRAVLHSICLVSSAVFVLLMKREWFISLARVGAAGVLVTAVLFMTVRVPQAQLAVIIVFGIAMGCVNSGILMPFVFTLNNTEKLYSVVVSNLIISALVFFQEKKLLNITNGFVFSFVMLVCALAATLFFKSDCLKQPDAPAAQRTDKSPGIIYLTLAINCLYAVLCKGVGRALLSLAAERTALELNPVYYIGGGVGCAIYLLIYALLKKSNHWTWNVTFATFAIAMMLNAVGGTSPAVLVLFALFIGIASTMGMINMYYILGVIGKKYCDMRYIRLSILLIGVCGGVSGVMLGRLITNANNESTAIAFAVASTVAVVVLLCLSPTLSFTYYKEEWADDSQRADTNTGDEARYAAYGLSEREGQLCTLLLAGCTLRQASARMGVAYATANTYCTSLYRKLAINSRVELINRFKES